jgi:hypothetical protein
MNLTRRQLAAACFAGTFILLAWFFIVIPVLWDGDSYYHLAVSRLYVEEGVDAKIPWARYSLLSAGADKEFLFHVLLMPFAAMDDPALGGRLALALFNAAIITTLGVIASRFMGPPGFLLAIWMWLVTPPFFARAIRLRPELLALLLLLWAIDAASRRKYAALAAIGWAFALGYTAHHVFLAIIVSWGVIDWWRNRRIDVRLLLAPVAGALAGLVIRPHAIENARIWYVQNVLFFFNKSQLDVGVEILPPAMPRTLLVSLPWILALVALVAISIRHREREPDEELHRTVLYTALASIVFALLFTRMGRMATYVYPLVTLLAAAFAASRVPRVALIAILGAGLATAAPLTFDRDVRAVLRDAGDSVSELDWKQFGAAVPPGATVAARWGDAETYAFWAPQGRYLNVLDPIFMALPHRPEYDAQRRLFLGGDPDVPLTVARTLRSDYLAFDFTMSPPILQARLRSDPRLQVVYGGYNLLMKVRPAPPGYFVTSWSPLPAQDDPLAGFVDVTRFAASGCATVTHAHEVHAGQRLSFGFSPWGPSQLFIDGVQAASVERRLNAVLGMGVRVDRDVPPGVHTVDVRTCRAGDYAGFYLVDLNAWPAERAVRQTRP